MAYIEIGNQRYELPIGDSSIGGTDGETLSIQQLAGVPDAAVITVFSDRTATIRSTGRYPIELHGDPIGELVMPLAHGSKLSIKGIQITFGDIQQNGSTVAMPRVTEDPYTALASLGQPEQIADAGGRLVFRGGPVVPIPASGLVIGRASSADVVISGKGVSRQHAVVSLTLRGYVIRDQSANGVSVNGHRIDGDQVLGVGDVVAIGDDEFVFEAAHPVERIAAR